MLHAADTFIQYNTERLCIFGLYGAIQMLLLLLLLLELLLKCKLYTGADAEMASINCLSDINI